MTPDDRFAKVNELRKELRRPLPCDCCGETDIYRRPWVSGVSSRTVFLCRECFRLMADNPQVNKT